MRVDENLKEWAGLVVQLWTGQSELDVSKAASVRVELDYNGQGGPSQWLKLFDSLVESPRAKDLLGLVVGTWDPMLYEDPVPEPALVKTLEVADKLPGLRHLFWGDIRWEEIMTSDIIQANLTPLLDVFPLLESFGVRGTNQLRFEKLSHEHLMLLLVESGGMPKQVIEDISNAHLPSLESLELWLGDHDFGADSSIDDLLTILSGRPFPRLRHLGLCNSQYSDSIAKALANSPVMATLNSLDLSMGTLGDEGAQALLYSPYLPNLQQLNLRHHYMSKDMVRLLQSRLGTKVNVADRQEVNPRHPDRYVECSE